MPFEGDDALAVLQWQQEVIACRDVNWLELVADDVQRLERKLDVCESQLAKRHVANAWGRDERGQFVAEHDCLELLLAIAELLRELVDYVQARYQLELTCLIILKIYV